MLESKDREQWRRKQKMARWSRVVFALGAAVCALYLVQNSIALLEIALDSPEASEVVKQAFLLGWNGASPTEVYPGYQVWIRDVLGGAILNAMLLLMMAVAGLAVRQEHRREERMWAHIESLERELAQRKS